MARVRLSSVRQHDSSFVHGSQARHSRTSHYCNAWCYNLPRGKLPMNVTTTKNCQVHLKISSQYSTSQEFMTRCHARISSQVPIESSEEALIALLPPSISPRGNTQKCRPIVFHFFTFWPPPIKCAYALEHRSDKISERADLTLKLLLKLRDSLPASYNHIRSSPPHANATMGKAR